MLAKANVRLPCDLSALGKSTFPLLFPRLTTLGHRVICVNWRLRYGGVVARSPESVITTQSAVHIESTFEQFPLAYSNDREALRTRLRLLAPYLRFYCGVDIDMPDPAQSS